jgi:hypothetical protein
MTADQFGDTRPIEPKDRTDSNCFIQDRSCPLIRRIRPCSVPVRAASTNRVLRPPRCSMVSAEPAESKPNAT